MNLRLPAINDIDSTLPCFERERDSDVNSQTGDRERSKNENQIVYVIHCTLDERAVGVPAKCNGRKLTVFERKIVR